MNRDEALAALRLMLTASQKARSTMLESLGDDALAEKMAEDLNPWLFGKRSLVPKLVEYVSRVEAGAPIAGLDLFNFLYVAEQEPAIGLVAIALSEGEGLPERDYAWMGQVWA